MKLQIANRTEQPGTLGYDDLEVGTLYVPIADHESYSEWLERAEDNLDEVSLLTESGAVVCLADGYVWESRSARECFRYVEVDATVTINL